ncbi:MAG: hypothetical protein Q4C00_04225 [Bacillota bacterium]|nr:hypothetical protein [Bacillota bacterium]
MSIVILTFMIGVALVVFGWLIWRKERIQLIRDRHYRNVEDKAAYCGAMGKTIVAMGGLILISGIMSLLAFIPPWVSTMIFYIGIIGSVAAILVIQFRYNGGI